MKRKDEKAAKFDVNSRVTRSRAVSESKNVERSNKRKIHHISPRSSTRIKLSKPVSYVNRRSKSVISDYTNMIQQYSSQCTENKNMISTKNDTTYMSYGTDFVFGNETMSQTNMDLLNGPDGEHWKKANAAEFNSFLKNKAVKLVIRPAHVKVHRPKIVNVIKTKDDGTKKYKTRCVLAGWSMQKGIDYNETFSPTVRQDSLKTVLHQGLEIHHIDYETAY